MKLTFKKPIKFGEKTFTDITLREPTIGECLNAMQAYDGKTHVSASVHKFAMLLISSVATVHQPVVDQMKGSDVKKAMKFLNTFPLMHIRQALDSDGNPVPDETVYDDDHMIVLDQPITRQDGSLLTEVNLREPTISEMYESDLLQGEGTTFTILGFTKRFMKMVSQVSEEKMIEIERLPVSKFRECEKVMRFFSETSL